MIVPIMGMMVSPSLSNALFSKVQQRLLALLFGHPERSFYTAEIIRSAQSGSGAVERELSRLEQSGLVTSERIGNQKHYRANRASPIFSELYGIVQKTMGLKEPLARALEPHAKKIETAFVYGSVAKKTDTSRSDIDLMIIGEDIVYADIYAGLAAAEKILGRAVNPTIFAPGEWRQKLRRKNAFLEKVVSQPKIFIIGAQADLES